MTKRSFTPSCLWRARCCWRACSSSWAACTNTSGASKKQLRDELELAAVAVKENGTEYLSQLSSERYRLTWIENDGTVLYDTVTDAESLENHADRVEVKQALEYGEGESTRYSSTLLQRRCTARKGSRTGACCAFR